MFKSIPDCADPWLYTSSNRWPLDEHHYAEVFAVCSSIQADDRSLLSGLLTPTVHAAALRVNRGHCPNYHEDTHSLKQCRHPFINASGCLNLDLGSLDDLSETYRRCKARMVRYRRVDTPSRSNNQINQKNNHRRRGHPCGQHQSHGQKKISQRRLQHTRNEVTSILVLVITVEFRPRPPLPLLPPSVA